MANLARLPMPDHRRVGVAVRRNMSSVDPDVFFPPDSERGPVRQRRELSGQGVLRAVPGSRRAASMR